MSIRYESPAVALADLLMTAWSRLKRHKLAQPHRCDQCQRTVTSVPASRIVTPKGAECRRIHWSLSRCQGYLTKAVTS